MPEDESLPGVGGETEERFHRRYYRTVRVARVVGMLLLAAVGLGVAGTGPLSWAQTSDGELEVRYERFTRRGAPWVLQVRAPVTDGEPVDLTIDRTFHGSHEVSAVVPQPSSVTASDSIVTYTFDPSSTSRHLTVQFWFTADALWMQHAEVGLGPDGPAVSFDQFVYP